MSDKKHLGGHCGITHLDEGALKWAQKEFNAKSMIDVGCGPGGMTELAHKLGYDVLGVDGDETISHRWFDKSKFMIHDFTLGPAPIERKFDLCWSVEFVEHVHAEYIPNFVEAMKTSKVLFMTHATPGQGGYHHVNEQPEQYWIDEIEKYGFRFDRNYSNKLREVTTMNINGGKWAPYVKLTGLVFINEGITD